MFIMPKLKLLVVLTTSILLTACDNNATQNEREKINNYPVQVLSGFNIHYPTAFSMSREETERYFQILPENIQDVTTEMLVYKSQPVCELKEVRLVYFKVSKMVTYDIDAGSQGIIDNLAQLEDMQEKAATIKPLIIPSVLARHVYFEGKAKQQNVSYEGVLVADTKKNRVWQLQFISDINSYSNSDKYHQMLECTQHYVNSINITD